MFAVSLPVTSSLGVEVSLETPGVASLTAVQLRANLYGRGGLWKKLS